MGSDRQETGNNGIRGYLAGIFRKGKIPKNEPAPAESAGYADNLEAIKQDMIKGIIDLSDTNVREIMIPRVDVVALDVKATLKDTIKTAVSAGHSRIPVFENTIDNITGILYVKDLLKFVIDKPKKFILKKMLHKPYFVPETMTLDVLLLEFKKRKLHLAITVDEYGGIGGIVTLEDVLEEIVGEIDDEFDDTSMPEVKKLKPNEYEVDSRMAISDFNEETGMDLPADQFDTIGGLVFDAFGRIPKKNESADFHNCTFLVKDIKGTIINRVIITVNGATPRK